MGIRDKVNDLFKEKERKLQKIKNIIITEFYQLIIFYQIIKKINYNQLFDLIELINTRLLKNIKYKNWKSRIID